MTCNCVECKTEAQADYSADEECKKDEFLLQIYFPRWAKEEVNCSAYKHDASKQVSPSNERI